jgi:hypothetical protein
MTTKLDFQPIETIECDALVVVEFEGQPGGRFAELTRD